MANLKLSTWVKAPIARVFDAFSDFEGATKTVSAIQNVEMLTEGPVNVGTRFRETRVMFGREATEEMEVTAFKPNQTYTLSADTCGSHFESTFHFSPENKGTRVDMELNTRAVSLFAKLMWPLGFLMMPTMKKMMLADIEEVKQHCEMG